MPSITDKKKFSEREFSTYGAGGEPLGEPRLVEALLEQLSEQREQLPEGELNWRLVERALGEELLDS